ncbi:MAG: HD domain-containing protein [Verrucomicrobia bacterium]|nr:HD domain-containing protein [Verrucomicrobiota bacterium]
MIPIPSELENVFRRSPELTRTYLVGGCVRDALIGIPHKDFDIEVFGVSYDQLVATLSRFGRTDLVGRSFGVVKLKIGEYIFDFTIPRRDSKVASGHKGFEIQFDENISPREAASRRDFTVNAIMYDPRTHELLDFFGGEADLRRRILRHTSDAFTEDPLRVLRGMQFASRFNLQPAPETIELCRSIKNSFHELAVERVREEWFKWAEKSATPSIGLHFLRDTEWLEHFPELQSILGVPQDPEWHPEGDVFIHTCHCCDAMATLPEWQSADPESRIVYMLAVLLHDVGKAVTTDHQLKEGRMRIVSPGHEHESVPLAEKFLERIGAPLAMRDRVYPLIANHMAHVQQVTDRAVRRLSKRLEPENIDGLCVLMSADALGRPPRPPQIPEMVGKLREKANELQVHQGAPKAILLGRHLIELGLTPGVEFGKILHAAYDAQLEGVFFDLKQAREWLAAQKQFELPAEAFRKLTSAQAIEDPESLK